MHIEVSETHGEIRRRFFVPYGDIKIEQTDTEKLLSIFIHTQDAVNYKLQNKTLEGYSGQVMFNYLWIDIDAKDINHSVGFAHNFVDNLKSKYGLTNEQFVIYFSGRKGFHIGISSAVFGRKFFTSEKVPAVCKMLVSFLSGISPDDVDTMKSSPVDFGIYYTVSLLRSPMSRHPISKAYKIRIPYELVEFEDVDSIIENARECQMYSPTPVAEERNEKLAMLFDEVLKLVSSENQSTQIFLNSTPDDSIFKRTSKTVFYIPKTGERANALYKMAYRLFKQPDLLVEEVRDLVRIVFEATNLQSQYDGNNTDLLKIGQLRTLIDSAFRRARGKQDSEIKILTLDAMVRSALTHILQKKDVSTFISSIDNLHGGLVVGNFYPVIGQKGTKKSIFEQDRAIKNALYRDITSLFVNAEMSDVQFFKRGIAMAMKKDFYGDVLSGAINHTNVEEFISKIGSLFSQRLLITSEPAIKVEQIDTAIQRTEEMLKQKISNVSIDSFAALDGEVDELKKSMRISLYLKNMSKARGVATTIVCHVNQMCEPHVRDTSKYTRGGGKMADNSDGYFCTSLCIDMENSNPMVNDYKYLSDILFLRYVDKRESGQVIDTIVKLDENLTLIETNVNPKVYEIGIS